MDNVARLPGVFQPGQLQTIQDFDYEDFCALLEAGSCSNVARINGLTILNFPKIVIICCGDNCTAISTPGHSLTFLINEAHALLGAPEALAS